MTDVTLATEDITLANDATISVNIYYLTISGADPGFLEMGVICIKCRCVAGGGGACLLILSIFFSNIR